MIHEDIKCIEPGFKVATSLTMAPTFDYMARLAAINSHFTASDFINGLLKKEVFRRECIEVVESIGEESCYPCLRNPNNALNTFSNTVMGMVTSDSWPRYLRVKICGHRFHFECLESMLASAYLPRNSCPICLEEWFGTLPTPEMAAIIEFTKPIHGTQLNNSRFTEILKMVDKYPTLNGHSSLTPSRLENHLRGLYRFVAYGNIPGILPTFNERWLWDKILERFGMKMEEEGIVADSFYAQAVQRKREENREIFFHSILKERQELGERTSM